MALTSPSVLTEPNATDTATFTAQAAGGYLVAAVRRNLAGVNTAIGVSSSNGTGSWAQIAQNGPGDSASSTERVAWFGKQCSGDETTITFTNMTGGTRCIEIFYVPVPAGAGGSWVIQATKVLHSLATAGLTVLNNADLTHHSDDCCTFAQVQQSSSYSVVGNTPNWSGMTRRGTVAVGDGASATNVAAARNVAVNLDAVALTDTRRLTGAAFTLAYLKKPTVTLTPAAGTVSGTVSLVGTLAGGNADTLGVSFWQDDGANPDLQIGTLDTAAPYGASWVTTGLANGTYTLRALWQGNAEFGLIGLNFSADVVYAVNNAGAPTGNVTAVRHNTPGAPGTWVACTAIRKNSPGALGTWVTIWP